MSRAPLREESDFGAFADPDCDASRALFNLDIFAGRRDPIDVHSRGHLSFGFSALFLELALRPAPGTMRSHAHDGSVQWKIAGSSSTSSLAIGLKHLSYWCIGESYSQRGHSIKEWPHVAGFCHITVIGQML